MLRSTPRCKGCFFMAKKIWQTKASIKLHPMVEEFTSGEDLVWDQQLIPYDIKGSLAHAQMLYSIGILNKQEWHLLQEKLQKLLAQYDVGEFVLGKGDEDCHTAIEAKLGEVGKKIHTGRSRNDQVLVALKLYYKDKIEEINIKVRNLDAVFKQFAKKHKGLLMPGYTHMQKAMPSSVSLWADNFAVMLGDDLKLLRAAYEYIDQNPLGSGAAYGVSLPLDREMTTKLLGFVKTQENVLSAQNMRGKDELAILSALVQVMITLSKFAQDVLLFTMSDLALFIVGDTVVTGSSIMPQKKNVDVAELLRAKAQTMIGLWQQVAGVSSGLPSGYNRDLQETKGAIMQALKMALQSVQVAIVLLKHLQPNEKNLQVAMTPDLYLTDKAYELVMKGVPFREAYQKIKEEYEAGT